MRDYQRKLIGFNNTPKYKLEMKFMEALIQPGNEHENILDYGCGTGSMMKYLRDNNQAKVYGYDKDCYLEDLKSQDAFWWRQEFSFKFDKVYFMHSLAHIEDVGQKLLRLKDDFLNPGSTIYILTPNVEWMRIKGNPDYIKDPTVIQHFNTATLHMLLLKCGFKIESQGQYGEELSGIHERLFITAKF